jgi:predicted neutral ceramidase superfamily lipid hydrolase
VSGQRTADDLDRELIELLNELRVALPGVQVLFAFLLTVPFSQRFATVTSLQRSVYFASFICAALASAFLIAPSAYHRLRFRESDKEQMLLTSNRFAVVGMGFLALAITGVVYVVTDQLYDEPVAAGVTAAVAGLICWLWYGLPLSRHLSD